MAFTVDAKSGFCKENGVYYSKAPPLQIPTSDITTFVFSGCKNPSKTALIDAGSGKCLTYAALQSHARAIARGLANMGIKRNDKIMVVSPNTIMLPCIYFGILSLGAVLTTANPLSSEREIQTQVDSAQPSLILTIESLLHKFTGTASQVTLVLIDRDDNDNSPLVLTDRDDNDNSQRQRIWSLKKLIGNHNGKTVYEYGIQANDSACILYSSGTTGKSKGVVLTHKNLVSVVSASVSVEGESSVILCTMPLYHVYGLVYVFISFFRESTIVVFQKFDLKSMLSIIEEYKVEVLPASPPVLVALVKSPLVEQYDLSSLKIVGSGGAPLGKEAADSFRRKFPGVEIVQGYGLTETSGPLTLRTNTVDTKCNGIGILMPNIEAKIVDTETGKPLPPNHKGELWFRGPSIMREYLGNSEATSAAIDSEGWFKTGDLCYIDEDGILYVVDRIKELIKYKGFQVAPVELEELLLCHSEILDAAVIPYPDEEAGEIPMAFVVRKPNSNLTEKDVIDFIAKQVSPYKKVRKVAMVESIPKSPAGKILRKILVQQVQKSSKL